MALFNPHHTDHDVIINERNPTNRKTMVFSTITKCYVFLLHISWILSFLLNLIIFLQMNNIIQPWEFTYNNISFIKEFSSLFGNSTISNNGISPSNSSFLNNTYEGPNNISLQNDKNQNHLI